MAKLGISTGSQPNDGTGDTLLSGAEKVNANFTEVYTLCGDGTNLAPGIVTAIAAGDNISVSGASGQVTITALEDNVYLVEAVLSGTGTEATPFADS